MLNYLKSEIYRNIHSKGNYIFIGGCSAFVIFLVAVLNIFHKGDPTFPYSSTGYAFSSLTNCLMVPLVLCDTVVRIVNGNEFKNKTLKNTVAFGISRKEIYLGKILVELIVSILTLIIVTSCYVISAYLLLENSGFKPLNTMITSLICAVPLFILSLIFSHALYFCYDNETQISAIWILLMFVFPIISNMLASRSAIFGVISEYMPLNMIAVHSVDDNGLVMYWSETSGLIKCILVGIIGSAIFYISGLRSFKKREIK